MSVIGITVAMPHAGKRAMTENRARHLGGIYARHGAAVRVASVVTGPNTGCIAVMRAYSDFRSAAAAFQAIQTDPAHIEFWRDREANPSADIVMARDIIRTVYGENQWDSRPVSHLRQYEITRDNLEAALKLMPGISKLMAKAEVNAVAVVPVTGENLSAMTVSYQFRSIEHWGDALDTVGTSDEFQAIVAKAGKLGTLRSAFAMAPL